MLQPENVAACCAAMRAAVAIPITVKCRIGALVIPPDACLTCFLVILVDMLLATGRNQLQVLTKSTPTKPFATSFVWLPAEVVSSIS